MVMILKDKLYNLSVLWLTLSLVFFIVESLSGWLNVVTLGGLIAGSVIEGVFIVFGIKFMRIVLSKEFYLVNINEVLSMHSEIFKAMIVTAAFSWEGVLTLVRTMPGYTMYDNIAHIIFLLVIYPLLGITLELIINKKGIN